MAAFRTVIILFLLSLATNVLAARVNYVAEYHGVGIDGKEGIQKEKKAGGNVEDPKDAIVSRIGTWSNGKYKASKHAATGIITVTNNSPASGKSAATSMVQDMQQTVNQGLKSVSRSPSPAGSRSGSRSRRSLDYAFDRRDLDYDFERRGLDYDFERRGLDYDFERRDADSWYDLEQRDLDYDFERRDADSWYDLERRGLDDSDFELYW